MPTAHAKRWGTDTLRFRLMLWNALVVMITALVMLVGLREGVRITLIRELDQLLGEDLRELELSLASNHGEDAEPLREQLDRKAVGHAQHKWFVQIRGQDDRLVYQSDNTPEDVAPFDARSRSARTKGAWRFVDRRLPQAPGFKVRIGASLEMIRGDVRRLDRLVLAAVGLILCTAPLGGYWLAGRATRPLNQMISTMAKLRPSKLQERLPLRGTGDELDRLSQTFNRLLDRIGTYLKERQDFLANAAHELRTPLAAIRSSIEVALASQRSSAEYEELLSDIIEESTSLEMLVNQLLLLSETEGERLRVHKEQVRFDELVEKALDMFGGVAEYRDILLTCPALPIAEVNGNRQHLRQVIYNLLDNALKYTPAGGRVAVNLVVADGQLIFSVRDNGPGIRADDLPHVFDRFFQGDRKRQGHAEIRGAGLGLSICRAIVGAHDGRIEVDSEPGRGARFLVRLPLMPLRDEVPAPLQHPTEEFAQ